MIAETIGIAAVQSSLYWENRERNLEHFTLMLRKIDEPVDVIVLPEMFTTGFSMNPAPLAEKTDGPTLAWMRQQAVLYNAVITGSIITEENGQFMNRLLWVRPDGTYETYDKRHLFRMAGEDQHYASGQQPLIVDLKGWKIRPLICYDLRFPVWSRNRWNSDGSIADYDVLIYVANWPERRSNVWKTFLPARAMENQAYVIGVNRIGNDAHQVYHTGDSVILDFKGEPITSALIATEEILTSRLSMKDLVDFRAHFPVGRDADTFTVS
jgi:omega-amidase